jgi:class 3 adenylate cyclase/peroxiredoxin
MAVDVQDARSTGRDAAPGSWTGSTATLLFTDLVGSTELYARLGDDAAEELRRRCFKRLRDAARAYEGREVKTLGDGLMLAFTSSVKALSCAIVMQQSVEHDDPQSAWRRLNLRIGVNVGEAIADDVDDFFGTAVVIAKRLCDHAQGGQVLVSETVRSLVGSRGGFTFRPLGPTRLKGLAEPVAAYEVGWRRTDVSAEADPGGALETPLGATDVAELERVLALSGLADISLSGRYSVIFTYPGMGIGDLHRELQGCTTQVCAIIEEADRFSHHGIQVVGLSTRPSAPPSGCSAIPFPVGLLPSDAVGGVIGAVDKPTGVYAERASYLVFPNGTGVRISDVRDVIAHVKKSFEMAWARRMEAYREAAIGYLESDGTPLQSSTVELRELLATGADSVAIPRVDVKLELVCKLAAPEVIAAEATYVDRVNRLLLEDGRERLFPAVLSICTDEDPAWYLMEALNPVSLERLLFVDDARTGIRPDRRPLLTDSLARMAGLYDLTFRRETPRVSRYHYLERFVAIPRREDFRAAASQLLGDARTVEERLETPIVIEPGFACRPYADQVRFLERAVDELVQPVGAFVHGDLHLPNMLLDRDGERVVFIDPRTVWDGHDLGEPGFCDPMYDLATLMHSLHFASAVLRAIEQGTTEHLLCVEGDQELHLSPGILRIHENAVLDWFIGWVEHETAARVRGRHWRARLHVGAANATLGWLKYARAVKTGDAWLALFSAGLYHLERARRELEEGRER